MSSSRFRFVVLAVLIPSAMFCQESADTVKYVFPPVTSIGTRTTEPWIKVPLAITAIHRQDLSTGKGYGLDEVLGGIPGVLAQSRYGNQDVRLIIRGFGARGAGAKSNAGTTRGIRILLDGFPETEPDGRTSLDLLDLSSAGGIEVVRSNVSSVYGNASGGVVNVLSNTSFGRPYAEVQSTAGSYGYHAEAVRAGAMLGAGRFFLSLTNRNADGWRVHSRSTQSLLNTGVVTPLADGSTLGIYVTGSSNAFRIPGPLSQAQFDSLAQQADSTYIKRDERRFNRLGRIGLSLSHAINDGNVIGATAFLGAKYLQRSERNSFRDFTRYHIGGSISYRNATALSSTVTNSALVGADFALQDGAIEFRNLLLDPVALTADRGTTITQSKTEGARHAGAFVQDEIGIGGSVTLLMGARYDNITYFYDNLLNPKVSDTRSFERITPKAGITWMLTPLHAVYANLGGGVEVPAGNEVDPAPTFGADTLTTLNPLLAPIHSTTVEVGTKHVLPLDGAGVSGWLTYDIALYWLQVSNDIIPYDDGGWYFTAGRTRRMGLEAAMRMQLAMGVTIDGALTLSNNAYSDYSIDSVYYGRPGRSVDLSGNTMAGVPDLFYSMGLRYTFPGPEGVFIRAGVQGVGGYFADDRNLFSVPASVVVNVLAGVEKLRPGSSGLFLRGYAGINNIADQKYAAAAWINPQLNSKRLPVYLEPGLPRNVVGSVSIGWEF